MIALKGSKQFEWLFFFPSSENPIRTTDSPPKKFPHRIPLIRVSLHCTMLVCMNEKLQLTMCCFVIRSTLFVKGWGAGQSFSTPQPPPPVNKGGGVELSRKKHSGHYEAFFRDIETFLSNMENFSSGRFASGFFFSWSRILVLNVPIGFIQFGRDIIGLLII